MLLEERTYTMEEIERETGLDRRTIAYYVQEGLLPKVGRRGPRTRYPRQFVDRLLFIQKIRGLQDRGELGNYTLEDIREIFETVPERLIADIVTGRRPLEIASYGGRLGRQADGLGSPRERIERVRRLSEGRSAPDDEPTPLMEALRGPASDPMPKLMRSPDMDDPRALREVRLRSSRSGTTKLHVSPPELEAPPPAAPTEDASRLYIDLDEAPAELELRRVCEEADVEEPVRPFLRQALMPEPPHPLVRLLARLDRAAGQVPKGAIAESWTRAEVTPDIVLTVRGLDQDSAQLLERIARLLRRLIESERGSGRDDGKQR
jgi:DNA-binding transcriptional MerR regulator